MTISWILLPVKKNSLIKFIKSLTLTASEETRKDLNLVGTRPGIMYGSCKVHKNCVDFICFTNTLHTSLQSI